MKLVLTGGPSGGKTTMAMSITKVFAQRVVMIPESASILFGGGFSRRTYADAVKLQQQAIYAVQVAHEAIYEMENKEDLLMVCDRGTLDGWAYWPNEKDPEFFSKIQSSEKAELSRYDWVIHLDTAGSESYDKENVIRIENHTEADLINERIKQCWSGHPRRFIIPSTESFFHKVSAVMSIVEKILAGTEYEKIKL
ncbi:MAG: ATP-binding protein [Bdellovibrionaceae bacterium]|nr:ATP-binding protein [Bdellovibrionales bacterium]MCB9082742.1 ATP-binding protein [Pseudobdellovibrionaceae bacterium]